MQTTFKNFHCVLVPRTCGKSKLLCHHSIIDQTCLAGNSDALFTSHNNVARHHFSIYFSPKQQHLPIKFSSFLAKFSDKWQAFPLSKPSFLTC